MDPTIAAAMAAELVRVNAVGTNVLNGSQQNSERLSAMFGVRAAQSNPIEASSISTLNNASGANNTALSALIMALMNQAHGTPSPYTVIPQAANLAPGNK